MWRWPGYAEESSGWVSFSRLFSSYCDFLAQTKIDIPIGWGESAKSMHISIPFRAEAITRVL
jgi:hypothetical protein